MDEKGLKKVLDVGNQRPFTYMDKLAAQEEEREEYRRRLRKRIRQANLKRRADA